MVTCRVTVRGCYSCRVGPMTSSGDVGTLPSLLMFAISVTAYLLVPRLHLGRC